MIRYETLKPADQMTEEELAHFYAKCMEDYHFFAQMVLGHVDMNDEHLDLCRFLEKDSKSKLILMPRYTFKSCIITQGFTLWKLLHNPDNRILIYSDSATKAQNFLLGIKNHIEGKTGRSRFREFFSGWETTSLKGKWNDSQINISLRRSGSVEPSVDTAGIETSKVGMHYDIIIFDDIVSDLNVTTKAQMDKVHDCYKKSLSLLRPGGILILTGTRWHFADCYGRIIEENKERGNFDIFIKKSDDSLGLYFDDIGPDSLTHEFLVRQKSEQGSYIYSCNPAEAPILMDNWDSKPISEVKEGEYVVGWGMGSGTGKRKVCRSKVIKVQSRLAHVVKIFLESGKVIRCTPDHNWFINRFDKTHRMYAPAKISGKLFQVYNHWLPEVPDDLLRDAAWLGGMFDGEGHCSAGSINIAQCRNHNPEVHKRIGEVLTRLGFDWGFCSKDKRGNGNYWINASNNSGFKSNGRTEKLRFIKWCKPVKAFKIIDSFYKRNSWLVEKEDKVVDIRYDKEEIVYALQTETGNYVAWGFASKNCIYQNNPVSDDSALFKYDDFRFYGQLKQSSTPALTGLYGDLYITGTLDPAGEGEDFTAGTICGTDSKFKIYILELLNKRNCTPTQMIEWILSMNRKYRLVKFGVETIFFRGMFERDLQKKMEEERLRDSNFNNFGVEKFLTRWRHGEGKKVRIEGMQPYHERGDILFPGTSVETLKGAFGDLAYQMMQTTRDHMPEPNDLIDSLSWQISIVQKGGMPEPAGPPKNSPAWLEEKWIEDHNRMQRRLPSRMRRRYEPSLS